MNRAARLTLVLVPTVLLTLGATSAPSMAAACVEIDTTRDMLPPQEQRAAVLLVSGLLEEKGVQIVEGPCSVTYRLHHVLFGESVTVILSGPNGSRQATVTYIESVPALYSQLVNALVHDVPLSDSNVTVDRRNVTPDLSQRRRVDADKVWFVRLGFGTALHDETESGAAYGFGFRYELDTAAVELSFLDFINLDDDAGADDFAGSFVRIMGLRFTDPVANASPYFGAGLSWSRQEVSAKNADYQGSGVQAELRVGYEMLRASTIRLFVQLDAGLPLYDVDRISYVYFPDSTQPAGADDSLWVPTFTVSLGVGFGGHGRDDHDRDFRPVRLDR